MDVCWRDSRHRHGARDGGSRSRCVHCRTGCAVAGAIRAPTRLSVAVQPDTARAGKGRQPLCRTDRLAARQSSSSTGRAEPGRAGGPEQEELPPKVFGRDRGIPARFIETVRLDMARMLLSRGLSLKEIGARVGLSSGTRLTAAFERRFGVTPRLFRENALHGRLPTA